MRFAFIAATWQIIPTVLLKGIKFLCSAKRMLMNRYAGHALMLNKKASDFFCAYDILEHRFLQKFPKNIIRYLNSDR